TSASFTFGSNTPGSTRQFFCKLDARPWVQGCASPKNYSGLAKGPHTFSVRATDDGKAGSPTTATWSVVADDGSGTMTSTTDGVSASATGKTVSFTYTAATGGISDGTVRLAVPSGWSVPSVVAS